MKSEVLFFLVYMKVITNYPRRDGYSCATCKNAVLRQGWHDPSQLLPGSLQLSIQPAPGHPALAESVQMAWPPSRWEAPWKQEQSAS